MFRNNHERKRNREHPADDCSRFWAGALLVAIWVGIALNMANYATLDAVLRQIHTADGIPGENEDRLYIKTKMTNIKTMFTELRGKKGDLKRRQESRNSSETPIASLKTSASVRDADATALDAIDQLLGKFWPYINNVTTRSQRLAGKLEDLNGRLTLAQKRLEGQRQIIQSFIHAVEATSSNQMVSMLAKSFGVSKDKVEMRQTSGNLGIRSVNCTPDEEPKSYQNWMIAVKEKKSAQKAQDDCYKNGGEYGFVEDFPPSLIRENEEFWGLTFHSPSLSPEEIDRLHCNNGSIEDNAQLPCSKEYQIREHKETGQLLHDLPQLRATEPFVHRGSGENVGFWFAKISEKRLHSACFVWRTLLRWGFDIKEGAGDEGNLAEGGSKVV